MPYRSETQPPPRLEFPVVLQIIILLLGALGHAIFWVALVNRLHATNIKRRWVSLWTVVCVFLFAVIPVAVYVAMQDELLREPERGVALTAAAAWIYVYACAVVAVVASVQRLLWRFHSERKGALAANDTKQLNAVSIVAEPLVAPGLMQWLARLPRNQVLDLSIHEKHLRIPRLAEKQSGIRVAHLSDLHMSGRLTRAFYEFIVAETNRLEADIIAITGDLVDSNDCLPWIPEVLGNLRAPAGVFFVLGNHDQIVDQHRLHEALAQTDWTHLAGPPVPLCVRGVELLLAGNEMPWYPPSVVHEWPQTVESPRPLRIVLSHSPDQFGWACSNDVDLMLAGHVHGGQFCLPLLGPVTAPSMHGVRYAAGTFRSGDTVMHVSRGTASLTPLRWNCPPEITVLTLTGSA